MACTRCQSSLGHALVTRHRRAGRMLMNLLVAKCSAAFILHAGELMAMLASSSWRFAVSVSGASAEQELKAA
jgi:hypothetical protein